MALSQKEWGLLVERGLRRYQMKLRQEQARTLRHYLPIPIILGLIACILDVLFFGWQQFFHDLLSWTIGITVVTTAVALFSGKKTRRRR